MRLSIGCTVQTLIFALMLALASPAEEVEAARAVLLHGQAQTTLPSEAPTADPCARARRIAQQPPCLERGDCRSLELWRRSFGAPRFEPADPERGVVVYRATPGRRLPRSVPPLRPDPRWRLRPGTVCPAGVEPQR